MADYTAEFFDALAQRRHEPRLAKVAGTLRFDLERNGQPEYWYVEIRQGDLTIQRTPEPRSADCILRTTRTWFDKFVTGEDAVLAALLRAEAVAEGNVQLMFQFQRLIPDSPGSHDPRNLPGHAAGVR